MIQMLLFIYFIFIRLVGAVFSNSDSHIFSSCHHYGYRLTTPRYGWHVICVKLSATDEDREIVAISILRNGVDEKRLSFSKQIGNSGRMISFLKHIAPYLEESDELLTSWAVFAEDSLPLLSVDRMLDEEVTFLCTNGYWMWPGVAPGYTQYSSNSLLLTTVSTHPLVFHVQSLLNRDECIAVERLAVEVSSGRSLSQFVDDVSLRDIDARVGALVGLRSSQSSALEMLHVCRLEEGRAAGPQLDFVDVEALRQDEMVMHRSDNGRRNRFATVLIQVSQHSSDVIFASSSDHELIHADPTSCTFRASESEVVAHGVSEVSSSSPNKLAGMNRVTLGPGEALLYYNTHVNGSWDLESEHVICPSDEGNRIVAHKWIWA